MDLSRALLLSQTQQYVQQCVATYTRQKKGMTKSLFVIQLHWVITNSKGQIKYVRYNRETL
jgi:hypothetical protein